MLIFIINLCQIIGLQNNITKSRILYFFKTCLPCLFDKLWLYTSFFPLFTYLLFPKLNNDSQIQPVASNTLSLYMLTKSKYISLAWTLPLNPKLQIQCQLNIATYPNTFRSELWTSPQDLFHCIHSQFRWLIFHIDIMFSLLLSLKGLESSLTPSNTLIKLVALSPKFTYHFQHLYY